MNCQLLAEKVIPVAVRRMWGHQPSAFFLFFFLNLIIFFPVSLPHHKFDFSTDYALSRHVDPVGMCIFGDIGNVAVTSCVVTC